MKRRIGALFAALPILGAVAPPARAVTLGERYSTRLLCSSDEFGKEHFDPFQYLRFNARQFDAGDTVQVTGFGREGDGA